ncbi:MAG: hypothetical protein AAF224_06630 [Pseudomonadota bacterium]
MQSFLHNLCTAGVCGVLIAVTVVAFILLSSIFGAPVLERMD